MAATWFPMLLALIVIPCLAAQIRPPNTTLAAKLAEPRPKPEDAALFARWLVAQNSWGVLTTLDGKKAPFGNIMSFTDAGTGIPYFYQSSKLDPTGMNAAHDTRSSFTLTEYVLGYCDNPVLDPQHPKCAKITLSGQLIRLKKNSKEADFGEAALFARHPQFQGFPKEMKFDVFKLEIETIFLVNLPAHPPNVTVADYFQVKKK